MIYVALLFLIAFTGFFIWLTVRSLQRGQVSSRGVTFVRSRQPILYWLGIGAWLLNVLGGLFFLAILLDALLSRPA